METVAPRFVIRTESGLPVGRVYWTMDGIRGFVQQCSRKVIRTSKYDTPISWKTRKGAEKHIEWAQKIDATARIVSEVI